MPETTVPGPSALETPALETSMRQVPVTVHLLRHGLVENPAGVLYGRLPGYHLSAVGRTMAERIAQHFADQHFAAQHFAAGTTARNITYVASSPLERAQETAAPIASALGRDIVTDTRLIEPTNVFEGTKFAVGDGVLKKPQNWGMVRDPFTPSWGEAYISIARRMLGAVYAAVDAVGNADQKTGLVSGASRASEAAPVSGVSSAAVLVSHQLPIWTLRRFLEGKRLWHNPAKRQCGLGSLTSLTFHDGVLTAMRYSEPVADLVPINSAGSTGA